MTAASLNQPTSSFIHLLKNESLSAQRLLAHGTLGNRVLAKEVGGSDVELSRALNDTGGWKGRAQQIVMLKSRVKQLESQMVDGQRVSCVGYCLQRQGCDVVGRVNLSTTCVFGMHCPRAVLG